MANAGDSYHHVARPFTQADPGMSKTSRGRDLVWIARDYRLAKKPDGDVSRYGVDPAGGSASTREGCPRSAYESTGNVTRTRIDYHATQALCRGWVAIDVDLSISRKV